MEKKTFEVNGKKAALYRGEQAGAPLVVLNSYSDDGAPILQAMREIGAPDRLYLSLGDREARPGGSAG